MIPPATATKSRAAMSRLLSLALPTYHMAKKSPTKMTAVPKSGWMTMSAMGIRSEHGCLGDAPQALGVFLLFEKLGEDQDQGDLG